MYRWSGMHGDVPVPVAVDLRSLRPEAMSAVEFLSDDGGTAVDGIECKALPMARQTFRAMETTP